MKRYIAPLSEKSVIHNCISRTLCIVFVLLACFSLVACGTNSPNDDDYNAGYAIGYSEGYDYGYTDGYNKTAFNNISPNVNILGYEDGYIAGYLDGYKNGYQNTISNSEPEPVPEPAPEPIICPDCNSEPCVCAELARQEIIEQEIAEINQYISGILDQIKYVHIPALDALYEPLLILLAQEEYELRSTDRYLGTQAKYEAELKEYSNQLQSLSISHQKNQKFVEDCKKAGYYGDSYYTALANIQAYNANRKLLENAKSSLENEWKNQLAYLEAYNTFYEIYEEYQEKLSYYENEIAYYEALWLELIEEVYQSYNIQP